jgi:hypothetical protein
MIATGTIYQKDGWHVVVHEIRNGEVYYQRFPPDVEEQPVLCNLGRMTIAQFEEQVKEATVIAR